MEVLPQSRARDASAATRVAWTLRFRDGRLVIHEQGHWPTLVSVHIFPYNHCILLHVGRSLTFLNNESWDFSSILFAR